MAETDVLSKYKDLGISTKQLNTYKTNAANSGIPIEGYLKIATGRDENGNTLTNNNILGVLKNIGIVKSDYQTYDRPFMNGTIKVKYITNTLDKEKIPSELSGNILNTLTSKDVLRNENYPIGGSGNNQTLDTSGMFSFISDKSTGINSIQERNLFFANDDEIKKYNEQLKDNSSILGMTQYQRDLMNKQSNTASNLNSILSSAPSSDLTKDDFTFLIDKASQGVKAEDLAQTLQDRVTNREATNTANVTYTDTTTTTPSTTTDITQTTTPTTTETSTVVASKDPAKIKEYVDNAISSLGYNLSDAGKKELQDHFIAMALDENMPAMDQYTIKNLISGEAGYTEQQREAYKTKAGEELTRQGQEYLTQQALPAVERTYKRLGGTNRASTAAALGYAAADVAKQRQSLLANIETTDTLQSLADKYNQAMNERNQLYQKAATTEAFNTQKYWQSVANQQARTQNIITDRRRSEDWTQAQALAEKQRQWQLEDYNKMAQQQNAQNWWNLGSSVLGTATGIGLYKWLGKG